MQFNLIPLTAPATPLADASKSVFGDIKLSAFNRLGQDGDGRLVIEVAGADPVKTPTAMIVFARFGGRDFGSTRRQFYASAWSADQEATAPDCTSLNGDVPDASSPSPQSATCKSCPRNAAQKCGYRKDFVVYRVVAQADGSASVDTDTPLLWSASSKSLFPEFDRNTNAGGVLKLLPLMVRKYGETIEGLVFELGFFNGTKAPVVRVAARLPEPVVQKVLAGGASEDVLQLLEGQVERASKPALPAPNAAPALPAPPAVTTTPASIVPPVVAAPIAPPPAPIVPPVVTAPIAPPPVVTPTPAPAPTPVVAAPAPAVVAQPAMIDTPFGKMTPEMFASVAAEFQAKAAAASVAATAVPAAPPVVVAPPVAAPAIAVDPAAGTTAAAPASRGRAAALAAFGR